MSNKQFGEKAIFVPGLFMLRNYVCDQDAPSGAGKMVFADTLEELKKKILDEFEQSFDADDEDDLIFKDNCDFSDFEIGDGDNFVLADIVHLPDDVEVTRKSRALTEGIHKRSGVSPRPSTPKQKIKPPAQRSNGKR